LWASTGIWIVNHPEAVLRFAIVIKTLNRCHEHRDLRQLQQSGSGFPLISDMRGRPAGTRVLWFLLLISIAPAQSASNPQNQTLAPANLVRQAVQNEVATNSGQGMRFMFKDEKRTPHGSQTKLIVETGEATAGLLVAVNDRTLTPAQQQAEEARLQSYIHDPEQLNKKRKQEQEDAERTAKIVRALPDAFLYDFDGTQAGTPAIGRTGDELVRLKFRPNPDYEPPSRVEQVLTGMQGIVLVDAKEYRIAEIDGTLQKDVGFGWGILGHLDRGGQFVVQQADVVEHHWEVTRMELSFTGKILLFKKLSIHSVDIFSDFRSVPPTLTFAQGVDLLKQRVAQEQSASKNH
jgi:hypothetical protein